MDVYRNHPRAVRTFYPKMSASKVMLGVRCGYEFYCVSVERRHQQVSLVRERMFLDDHRKFCGCAFWRRSQIALSWDGTLMVSHTLRRNFSVTGGMQIRCQEPCLNFQGTKNSLEWCSFGTLYPQGVLPWQKPRTPEGIPDHFHNGKFWQGSVVHWRWR